MINVSYIGPCVGAADSSATWDTPPPLDSDLYPAFKTALKRYLRDRLVVIPILSEKEREKRETKAANFTRPPTKQPECIVGGVSYSLCVDLLQLADESDFNAIPDEWFPVALD
jgi:hypothetical protein